MIEEIKLKYFNSKLNIGFNDWNRIYDCNKHIWLESKEHKGRLVYGNNRIPYTKIKYNITTP